jgi:hypothetical protein
LFLPLLSAPLLGPLLAPLATSFLRGGSLDVDVLCLGKGVLGRSGGLFLQCRLGRRNLCRFRRGRL